jgi:hypothetical protein
MDKTFRILEIIWLILGCIGVLMCVYTISIGDTRGSIYFLVFTLASGMMYAVRKRQRLKAATAEKDKQQIKK